MEGRAGGRYPLVEQVGMLRRTACINGREMKSLLLGRGRERVMVRVLYSAEIGRGG